MAEVYSRNRQDAVILALAPGAAALNERAFGRRRHTSGPCTGKPSFSGADVVP